MPVNNLEQPKETSEDILSNLRGKKPEEILAMIGLLAEVKTANDQRKKRIKTKIPEELRNKPAAELEARLRFVAARNAAEEKKKAQQGS